MYDGKGKMPEGYIPRPELWHDGDDVHLEVNLDRHQSSNNGCWSCALQIQLQAQGKNIVDFPLIQIICMNPTGIQNPMQRHIQDRTRAKVFNLYSSAELGTAGMLFQCEARSGQHIQEDFFYPEIIAFNSDMPVTDPHQMGELVVTSLQAEAMPLIRYRTGQAVSMIEETCSCGRTLRRVNTPFSFG